MPRTPPHSLSLADLRPGVSARITAIRGGREITRRLMGLGLRVGSEVRLLHHRGRGVVLAAGASRVALGGGVAEKILAETTGQAPAARARAGE